MNVRIELEINELKYAIERLFVNSGLSDAQARRSMPFCFPEILTDDKRREAENRLHDRHLIRAVAGEIQLDLSLRVAANSVLAAWRFMELYIGEKMYRVFIAHDYISLLNSEANSCAITVYDDTDEAVNTVVSLLRDVLNSESPDVRLPPAVQQSLDEIDKGDLENPVRFALTLFSSDAKLMWIAQVTHRTKGGFWLAGGENPNTRKLYCADADQLGRYVRDVFQYAAEGLRSLSTAQ